MPERMRMRQRRERADAVARAAAEVIRERGCFGLRVEEVAERAGVAKGTVYLDHRDKQGLVGSALAVACRDLLAELRLVEGAVPDRRARLLAAVRVLARATRDRPDLSVLLEGRLACAATWMGAGTAAYRELLERMKVLVRDALSDLEEPAGVESGLAAEAILAVASTPAWRQMAARSPEEAVDQLVVLMPGVFAPSD
jgi:AcrR family transcriptional regulator